METLTFPTEEYEITMREFLSNSSKYFDYAKRTPVSINNGRGEKFTIIYDIEDNGEEMASAEEVEMFRVAEQEYERGEYYKRLPGESWEAFFARIDADPEGSLVCNYSKDGR